MSEFVLLRKPYHPLIFNVEGIIWNDFVRDSTIVNEIGPNEISDLLTPISLNGVTCVTRIGGRLETPHDI